MTRGRDDPGAETTTEAVAGNANERFKRLSFNLTIVGVVVSVAIHFAAFAWFPSLTAADLDVEGRDIVALDLPPEVKIPPPPQAIARPATPRVAAAEAVSEDITIAPTTFEHNPAENLAPPPVHDGSADPREKPVYIARDVEPRLRNAVEIQQLLRRKYPPMLREAGVGGTVVLWVFVEPDGSPSECRVQQSSGYGALDRAAEEIAQAMEFSPAMSRDRPVGVWIAQPIRFAVTTG